MEGSRRRREKNAKEVRRKKEAVRVKFERTTDTVQREFEEL
jgi:hypothetical protein